MIKLTYTQYPRYFSCKIENINELSVGTLKQLESFAAERSGRVDYEKEVIIIPKHVELQYLQELFTLKGLNVFLTEKEPQVQQISDNATINFGKFKGQKWTDLSEDYLQWLSNNINSDDRLTAQAELQRRKEKKVSEKRNDVISFGKHKGELWEELPTPYLQWVAQNLKGEAQKIAADVLTRRS